MRACSAHDCARLVRATGTAWRPAWCAPSGRAARRPAAGGPAWSARQTWKSASRKARVAASAPSIARFSSAMCSRSLRITFCSGRPGLGQDAGLDDAARREGVARLLDRGLDHVPAACATAPRRSRAPAAASAPRAPCVRLTPKFSASSCSPSRSPGASFCARMASTTRCGDVVGWLRPWGAVVSGAWRGPASPRPPANRLGQRSSSRRPACRRAPHGPVRGRCRLPRRRSRRWRRSCRSGCPARGRCP